jgi:hypothetical protein
MRPRSAALLFASVVAAGALVAGPPVDAGSKPGLKHSQFVPSGSQRQELAKKFASAANSRRSTSSGPRISGLDPKLTSTSTSANTTDVDVHGSAEQVSQAVSAVGGTVQAAVSGVVAATVPTSSLATLATSTGVTSVSKPVPAYTDGTAVTQGVAASGASTWQNSGYTGAGVTVAIVDAGFANLASEIAANNLPAGTSVVGNHCSDVNDTDHGTAVAEIVHQMAPGATLKLYCIEDTIGLQAAEAQIQAAGIKIVNCSLAFPGDDRGDGTGGGPSSAAATVQTARQNGILWIESAGNSGIDHWTGNFSFDSATNLTKLDTKGDDLDYVSVAQDASAEFFLQWDDWPTSSLAVSLVTAVSDSHGNPVGAFTSQAQTPGSTPTLSVCFAPGGNGCIDTSGFPASGQLFAIGIMVPANVPLKRFDLDYEGLVSPNSLSCSTFNQSTNTCTAYTPSASSISEPASSPYALAVGAADVSGNNACGSDMSGTGTFPLENYSAQGPTIDSRVKPDIAAFDGTTGSIGSPFCGTSASAPHVAGAAALVAQTHPTYTADQLQSFLTQHANGGAPFTPPSEALGAGVLALGPAPTGSLTVTLDCTSRFKIATAMNSLTVHVVATLTGFSPNQQYQLSLMPPQQGTLTLNVTADVNGTLSINQSSTEATNLPVAVGNSVSWQVLTTTGQTTLLLSGTTVVTDSCGPLVAAPKARTTHDYDISGDGYADMLAIDMAGNLLYYPNNSGSNPGHVPFASASLIGSGWYGPHSPINLVAAGDVTGDGYADLIATTTSGALLLYGNNLNSNVPRVPYTTGQTIGQGWQGFTNVVLGDVNGDGYADIIATKSDGSLWYYPNNIRTNPNHLPFSSGTQIPGNVPNATGLGVGDVNGDGYADLLLGSLSYIHPNLLPSGSPYLPSFSSSVLATSSPSDQNPGAGFAVGDFENTGSDGVMAANPGGSGKLVYVKNPLVAGGQATATVMGSGWQYINRIVP